MPIRHFLFSRLSRFIVVIILLCGATVGYAQSPTQQLVSLLSNLQTMQANFVQSMYDKHGNAMQTSSGNMALQRPGLFRWVTKQPNQQLIIADGKTIWIYDKDLQQVTKQKQNINNNNAPGLLLSDSVSNLAGRFIIRAIPSSGNNMQGFLLIPKGRRDLFQSVRLFFNQGTLQQMVLQDALRQLTSVQFSQVETNTGLPASDFQFQPPAGVDVIAGQ